METTPRLILGSSFGPGPRNQGDGLSRFLAWLGGFLAAGLALAVGVLLAVFAAAAMTLIAVVGSVFVFFTGMALRARSRATVRPQVLEARKVGHAWVAYGWDRNGR
ncbi:MAG TPA: hypothetical protein VG407_15225 [Caulobacteraceae bacterium]|jgi:hypothetical protein|nr:hypothetical protein [Caulobacteraceae bacterium]